DAWQIGWDQRDGNTEIVFRADEMVGVVGLEGQSQQGRDRAKRDVALVPVETKAEHFFAFEGAFADDAGVNHRGGIGAGLRAGQTKTGNVAAIGEPRQPALLLLLCAAARPEFAG